MVEITDVAGSLFTSQYRAVKLAGHRLPKDPLASKGSVGAHLPHETHGAMCQRKALIRPT